MLSPLLLLPTIGLLTDIHRYFIVPIEFRTPFRFTYAGFDYIGAVYISIAVTLAVIAWLSTRYAMKVPTVLKELWNSQVLLTKKSNVESSSELSLSVQFLDRYQMILHSP